jgi:hypothetical protein
VKAQQALIFLRQIDHMNPLKKISEKKAIWVVQCILILSLFLPYNLLGQNNSLRINVKGFRKYDKSTVVINDSIQYVNNPQSNVDYQNSDVSITFFRKNKKFETFIGAGFGWRSSEYKNSRDIDTLFYQEETRQNQKGLQLHFGLLKSIELENSNFRINAGVGALIEFNFAGEYYSEYSLTTPTGNYSFGQSLDINYAKNFIVGPNFEVGFYYTFFKKISIGINQNNWFYWEDDSGENHYEAKKFTAGKIQNSVTKSKQKTKGNDFGKSHFFSFSCLYQF